MASSKWKTWEELDQKLSEKKIVFWGASNWVERTMNVLDKPVAYIVDNSKLNQGIEYCGYQVHAPVGTYKPNRFGLHDMAGNVQEWCDDIWIKYYDLGRKKFIGVIPGEGLRRIPSKYRRRARVLRGASFHANAWFARSAGRPGGVPDRRTNTIGVRPAMEIH